MIQYTSASQLTLEGFEHPFDQELDPGNRWAVLGRLIPWDELANIYARELRADSGRQTVNIRMILGAIIVKHRLGLSDRDAVDEIAENLYIQYFCGLASFQSGRPFDPSLFVDIRKRMGAEKFDKFNDIIIQRIENLKPKRKRILEDNHPEPATDQQQEESKTTDTETSDQSVAKRGKLKIDATVADQQILYPTDLGLINRCREESERLIDVLYKTTELKTKPRTYRRIARKQYLLIAKKKKKTKNR